MAIIQQEFEKLVTGHGTRDGKLRYECFTGKEPGDFPDVDKSYCEERGRSEFLP